MSIVRTTDTSSEPETLSDINGSLRDQGFGLPKTGCISGRMVWFLMFSEEAININGGLAERFIAPVLKTGEPLGSVGSNPTAAVNYRRGDD